MDKLNGLLEHIYKRQSWCPWCGKQCGYNDDCQIADEWNIISGQTSPDSHDSEWWDSE